MVRSSSSLLESLEADDGAESKGPRKPCSGDGVPPGDGARSSDGAPTGDGVPPGDGVPASDGVRTGSRKRHVRSFEPSTPDTPKKGRPVCKSQKTCQLCGAGDQDEDPTQVDYENTKAVRSGDGPRKLAIRWLYPRVEGMAQGKFCYYCGKTAELAYPASPLKSIKERVSTNEAERRTFFQRRNALVGARVQERDLPGFEGRRGVGRAGAE